MKKFILSLAVITIIVSCDKEAGITDAATLADGNELTQEEKDASYAFGITLGQRTEQYNANPTLKDSLDYDQVKEGVEDFLKSSDDKSSYYYGIELGRQIQGAMDNEVIKGHLSKEEIITGMMDYLNKKDLKVSKDSIQQVMDNFYQNRIAAKSEGNAKEGMAYMNKIKKEDGVKTTASGLAYKVVKEGTGENIAIGDKIKVKYTGKTIDGEVFDSSDKSNGGAPIEFALEKGSLIPGWIEGLQLMSKGGKYVLYVPAELGYGNTQSGTIEPGSTLIFDIEVVDITKGSAE